MALSPNNANIIKAAAREAGDHLKNLLPNIDAHGERNSYAHVWHTVKVKMGKSYSDCDDSQFDEILATIHHCRSNPS